MLLVLAEVLGLFVEYVGGPGEPAICLLGPLDSLATVEETTVREKVKQSLLFSFVQEVESLNKIAEALPAEMFKEHFILLIKRLASGDWFTSRTSACRLFSVAVSESRRRRQEGIERVHRLISCPSHPLLVFSSNSVKTIRPWYVEPLLPTWGYPSLGSSSHVSEIRKTDDEGTSEGGHSGDIRNARTRLLAVENCVAIGSVLTKEENTQLILPTMRTCIQDKSRDRSVPELIEEARRSRSTGMNTFLPWKSSTNWLGRLGLTWSKRGSSARLSIRVLIKPIGTFERFQIPT